MGEENPPRFGCSPDSLCRIAARGACSVTICGAARAKCGIYLPSMLLSGFMFPFDGMPRWARTLGNALPLTHFVRSARGVLLKGYGASEILTETWPVLIFACLAACIAVASYRRRLN